MGAPDARPAAGEHPPNDDAVEFIMHTIKPEAGDRALAPDDMPRGDGVGHRVGELGRLARVGRHVEEAPRVDALRRVGVAAAPLLLPPLRRPGPRLGAAL